MNKDTLAAEAAQLGRPLRLEGEELAAYAARAVTIDPDDMAQEFARAPGDIAYWGCLLAEAEGAVAEAKDHLKRVTATAVISASRQEGKTNQAQRDAMVEAMPLVREASQALDAADTRRRTIRAIADGVSAKLKALISLGAQLRRELDAGPYTP